MTPIRLIYLTTILTICSLYAAQPIQPVFQQEFHLSDLQAILFTTLMLAPLGLAPLLYGFILESFPIKKLLRYAILLMGISEMLFVLSDNYGSLLAIRGVQGLVIPALLTSLMSYVSYSSPPDEVQQNIALYIGSTTLGGFMGRILSGLCTDLFGWRFFFLVLGLCFFLVFFLLKKLDDGVQPEFVKPCLGDISQAVKRPHFFWIFASIFCVFFVFSAMMNFLPFRLLKLDPSYGSAGVGILYLGYAMGITVSLINKRIRAFFGSETRAIAASLVVFILGTYIFLSPQYPVLLFGMFVFCAGMFGAHTLLSGYLNRLANKSRAIANGLYISFYYAGGTFGSFLPSFLLEKEDWSVLIVLLVCLLCFSLFCTYRLKGAIARME